MQSDNTFFSQQAALDIVHKEIEEKQAEFNSHHVWKLRNPTDPHPSEFRKFHPNPEQALWEDPEHMYAINTQQQNVNNTQTQDFGDSEAL